MTKMTKEKCIVCGRETVSVIKTDVGYICYNCYAEQKNPPKRKRKKDNEEERMQCEFFELVKLFFPKLPDKLLFAVPNGGSRHIAEAASLKRQGVTAGVSDVILLIPKKGYASLCIEFKTKKGIQSDEQKEFQRQAENCRSKYVIVRSAKQGIDALKEYLL
nr:MAG TPA: Nuclease [Caudoviricetes sp.]